MEIKTLTVAMLLIAVLGTMLAMPATAATATRTIPGDCVDAGAEFTITISAEDYGLSGAVTETLCDNWDYVSVTGDVDDVQIKATTSNSCCLEAVQERSHTLFQHLMIRECYISGILRDDDAQDHTIAGATEVCVCGDPPDPISATRDISDQTVNSGSTFTVTLTLTANKELQAPALKENLPAGWTVTPVLNGGATYKASTTEWIWVTAMPRGETKLVIYDVTVPASAMLQDYYIIGQASAHNVSLVAIGGESTVTVVILCGDVNHDGRLSIVDATLALQMATNSTDIDFAADVNADGVVTSVDALMILQMVIS